MSQVIFQQRIIWEEVRDKGDNFNKGTFKHLYLYRTIQYPVVLKKLTCP